MSEAPKEFYLVDLRSICGNCLMFWAKDGQGYTCNLYEAGIYKEDHTDRDTDLAVPVEAIRTLVVPHVRGATCEWTKLRNAARKSFRKRMAEQKKARNATTTLSA